MFFVKSYGKIDSSWDMAKFQSILEEMSAMAEEHDMSLCLCEDKDGNIALLPNKKSSPIHIFVCGMTPVKIRDHWPDTFSKEEIERMLREKFWDNVEYRKYTIEAMVPRVYNCLVNGVFEYGHLRFLSEGRMQLAEMLNDANKLLEKHARPLVLGLKKSGGLAICPISEKFQFYAPLSCVLAKSGFWSVSDLHPYKIRRDPLFMMYEGIAYGRKLYGMPRDKTDKDLGILILENALEDAIRMRSKGQCRLVINRSQANVECDMKETDDESFVINREEFLDGDKLLHQRVSAVAKDMYEKFLQIQCRVDPYKKHLAE